MLLYKDIIINLAVWQRMHWMSETYAGRAIEMLLISISIYRYI